HNVSVNPAQDAHERLPSRFALNAGHERNKPARFVRILMRLLISSSPEAGKQISGAITHNHFAHDSDVRDTEYRLRPLFAFVQIGLEQRLHLFKAVLHNRKSGDARETVQADQRIDAGVERIDAQKASDKTLV